VPDWFDDERFFPRERDKGHEGETSRHDARPSGAKTRGLIRRETFSERPAGWRSRSRATPNSSCHFSILMWTVPNERSFLMSTARASIGAIISILSRRRFMTIFRNAAKSFAVLLDLGFGERVQIGDDFRPGAGSAERGNAVPVPSSPAQNLKMRRLYASGSVSFRSTV
jgi:hypothetical protein